MSISYLGIQLTRFVKTLFQHNYLPLHIKIQQDLQNLTKCEFSWMGRLATYKMIQLPQILYFFRTVPIPIPVSFLKSLQTLLSRYVWQGKKSRCSHSRLIKNRLRGGVGYIDFHDYFSASILTQLKEWFQPSPTTIWGSMESSYKSQGSGTAWLFSATLGIYAPTFL